MSAGEYQVVAEDRREAGPVALVLLLVFVALATVSGVQGWQLVTLPWSTWLVGLPLCFATNSIAFSPTDTMPLSLGAKATMGLESAIAGFTVLLVLARAVNVISS
jgi:hypothetical protein